MDNDKIERIAARKIEEIIDESKILKAFINRGDKGPIWDGNIFVYNGSSNVNKNFKGRIPVQIKGIVVEEFSGETRKYSIQINDLVSYLRDGGAIFFVVEIKNSLETKIYYANLIPLEIDDLLSNKKEGQKTISTELKALDVENIKQIENICHEFLYHRERQFSTIKHRLSMKDINEIETISFTIFGKSLLDYDFNKDYVIIYGQRSGDSLQLPLSKAKFQSITYSRNLKISIKSRVYFDGYKVERNGTNNIIVIGENIRMNLKEHRFNYKSKGSLKTRLKEIEFLKDAIQEGYFYIDKYKIDGIKVDEKIKREIDNIYQHLNEIKNLFAFFDIEDDLELDVLTKNDLIKLKLLIDIILYNRDCKKTGYKFPDEGPLIIQIGNINIAVFILTNKEGKIEIINFFDCNNRIECRIIHEDENINERGCIFTILKAEHIIKISNLDLQKLEDTIKSIPFSEVYANEVNLLILELIKSYDMRNDLTNCLSVAIHLCEWLEKHGYESDIYKINKFQAIKRIRELSKEEKHELIKIRENCQDSIPMLCAISILLENKSDFEYYFDKMNEEEQNMFKEYPIYSLVEQLKK